MAGPVDGPVEGIRDITNGGRERYAENRTRCCQPIIAALLTPISKVLGQPGYPVTDSARALLKKASTATLPTNHLYLSLFSHTVGSIRRKAGLLGQSEELVPGPPTSGLEFL